MKLDEIIHNIDKTIASQEQELTLLRARRNRFEALNQQYPEAAYESGSICLPGIWDKITCMRIERKRRYYSTSKINVKFLLGKRNTIDGMKIHTLPFESVIAETKYQYGPTKKREIIIFDYKKLIPIECPRRNQFLKRIKLYLINVIIQDGLYITDNSFEKSEFEKLLLLR
jgi:hypothetical protein